MSHLYRFLLLMFSYCTIIQAGDVVQLLEASDSKEEVHTGYLWIQEETPCLKIEVLTGNHRNIRKRLKKEKGTDLPSLQNKIKPGNAQAVRNLLRNGADSNSLIMHEGKPCAPIEIACLKGSSAIARLLFQYGAHMNPLCFKSLLEHAVSHKKPHIVRTLLDHYTKRVRITLVNGTCFCCGLKSHACKTQSNSINYDYREYTFNSFYLAKMKRYHHIVRMLAQTTAILRVAKLIGCELLERSLLKEQNELTVDEKEMLNHKLFEILAQKTKNGYFHVLDRTFYDKHIPNGTPDDKFMALFRAEEMDDNIKALLACEANKDDAFKMLLACGANIYDAENANGQTFFEKMKEDYPKDRLEELVSFQTALDNMSKHTKKET